MQFYRHRYNEWNLSQKFTPLAQINTIASFIKVIISDFQTCFHDEYALPTSTRHAVKVENRSRLNYFCA